VHRWALVLGVIGVATGARAEPVFLGTASRGDIPPERAQAFRAALQKAADLQGLRLADPRTKGEGTAQALARARRVLDDAATAYADGEYLEAFQGAAEAIAAFEQGPAYSDDPDAWSLFKDICALRALAALKLKKKKDAEDALRFLLVVQPKYAPNKSRAPPELLARLDEVKDELRSFPPAALAVKSKPAGAQVIVDGKPRGKTPVLVDDLTPGVHYVAMESNAGRFTQRVTVTEDGGTVQAALATAKSRGGDAQDVLRLLRQPVAKKQLVRAMDEVEDDTIVTLMLPAGRRVEVIGARVADGELKVVMGVRAEDSDNARERATFVLIQALRERGKDAWLDDAQSDDPSSLRDRLCSATGAEVVADDEEQAPLSPAVVVVSVIGGVAAAAAIAGGVGFYLYQEQRKNDGFTWSMDTSGL
jgi:hypothetical protein